MDLPDENALARGMRYISENAEDVHVEDACLRQALFLLRRFERAISSTAIPHGLHSDCSRRIDNDGNYCIPQEKVEQ